jgi:hypothetical protein
MLDSSAERTRLELLIEPLSIERVLEIGSIDAHSGAVDVNLLLIDTDFACALLTADF